MNLSPANFTDYFRAVHGHAPFAWQQRLLETVLEEGWARSISLPTASGKTAVLDIAVFALALQAEWQVCARTTPRRIALVVDRRIVVDDAFRRAVRIAVALENPTSDVVAEVARRLCLIGNSVTPLECAQLRGGIYREDRWARSPLQPLLLCSTVDQVGSRLLHRGYGVAPRAWPIHAGLLGHDTLIVLDEAHVSGAFHDTLRAIARLREKAATRLPGPWAAVAMTATPRADEQSFSLTEEERTEEGLVRRLTSSKIAHLYEAGHANDDGFVKEASRLLVAGERLQLVAAGRTTLVVLNRVNAARALFNRLLVAAASEQGRMAGATVILLTGRSRALDRDALLAAHAPRLLAGRSRDAVRALPPLVVVATQCVEVGADLDVDALLTEAAPLDALTQRFGRLDRLGELGQSTAVILCRRELLGDGRNMELPKSIDPVYGEALTKSWWWLQRQSDSDKRVDFGIEAMRTRLASADSLAEFSSPGQGAPHLFPVYCDLWVQTGPPPATSPDPAVFLHGPDAQPPDVSLVWRADLEPERPDSWADTIAAAPPCVGEVLSLPFHVAKAWLLGAPQDDPCADIESASLVSVESATAVDAPRHALLWAGPEESRIVDAAALRPGNTLVVPCAWGGADEMGWTGARGDPVHDLLEPARLASARPALLRIHPSGAVPFPSDAVPESWVELATLDAAAPKGLPGERELIGRVVPHLAAWAASTIAPALRETLMLLQKDGNGIRVQPHPAGRGLIVTGRQRLGADGRDFSDEDDLSSLASEGAVELAAHSGDVRSWARHFARGAGLPEAAAEAVEMAGYLHDLGKADPRFQRWLVGGHWGSVDPSRLLAKSDLLRTGQSNRRAREAAGYPVGARHELLSVRLAESAPGLLPDEPVARALTLHLVESHHGHCRPWAPVVPDPQPLRVSVNLAGTHLSASTDTRLERLDSGVAERFWLLVKHYGWWGLSFLEACLRLADHRASEEPGRRPTETLP